MTWTYSGNPSTSDIDYIRFLIQDTVADDPLLTNEEIQAMITMYTNVEVAAFHCAEAILAKFTRMVDTTIGDFSARYSQRITGYVALIARLKRTAALKVGIPYAGGISKSDKQIDRDNPDRVQPRFTKELHEDKSATIDSEPFGMDDDG